MNADTLPLLLCPICRAASPSQTSGTLRCSGCQTQFPCVDGIPVLMPDPDRVLQRWSAQLHAFDVQLKDTIARLASEIIDQSHAPRALQRLNSVVSGLQAHQQAIIELFRQAGIEPSPIDGGDGNALLAYQSLIHRDWAWPPGVDELTPALDAIVATLPDDFQLGNTLVLGAGTARLAWLLESRLQSAASVIALDINPLPLLVTQRLMRGEVITVYEFPAHPLRSDRACIAHQLRARDRPPPGLQLLLADGLTPPIRPGSIDTVITPWFVDQVPPDLAAFIPTLQQLLRPGGAWLNQGPFVYDPSKTRAAHRYCGDEFVQVVLASGFRLGKCSFDTVSHMASPHSTQGRTERVLTMHATYPSDAARLPAGEPGEPEEPEEPAWLRSDGRVLPVPPFVSRADTEHPVLARVRRLIDGQRSVSDLTRALIDEGSIAGDDSAEVVVRGCLRILWQQRNET